MNVGLQAFRVFLILVWLYLLRVSVHAVTEMGMGAAGPVFFGDLAHPWRAQFDTDFLIGLSLAALWLLYRARTWWLGLIWAVLAFNMGGLFTLAYLFVATFEAKGDMRRLLLGRHAADSGL